MPMMILVKQDLLSVMLYAHRNEDLCPRVGSFDYREYAISISVWHKPYILRIHILNKLYDGRQLDNIYISGIWITFHTQIPGQ